MNDMKIHNPILRGFHPDPSIIRVGGDYYLATSTFEWWPGVRLFHSRDLEHWRLAGYPLNRVSQLDLRGVGASQGIWAPCLTYADGTFYLVYTIVKSFYCNMYDTENYLVTTTDIMGEWSEPVALHNFGFDPSLFHDTDGRKYMVSMVTDHRVPKKYAGRLVLQEYDREKRKLIGPVREIYAAKDIFLEGPHIFRRKEWYYLFSADTGTGEAHGQTILRSKNIWGPYEMYKSDFMERAETTEAYSILTSRHHPELALQKAGHCDVVETQKGEWYAVHLCGRPSGDRNPAASKKFAGARRYILGRETAIQKMRWTEDDWLVPDSGSSIPMEYVQKPDLPEFFCEAFPERDDFDEEKLMLDYQSLRIPMDEHYMTLRARKGFLRIYGRSGLSSKFSQSMIARRITEYHMEFGACLEYEPMIFKQMAGLILLYDTDNYLYLHISHDEDVGKCITLLKSENRKYEYLTDCIALESGKAVVLRAVMENSEVQFSYQQGDDSEHKLGGPVNISFLSDEACDEGWFTGAMCGICCQDLTGDAVYADFDWFEVRSLQR